MPYREANYMAQGKNWCSGHGTRPKYCPQRGKCHYSPTPPKLSPPRKKSPPKSNFGYGQYSNSIQYIYIPSAPQYIEKPVESLQSKRKIKELEDRVAHQQNELKLREQELEREMERSRFTYSSISTRNAERNRQRFTCSLTAEIMKNPFDLPCGHCFEEVNIKEWINKHGTCPMCREKFQVRDLRRNLMAQQSIEQFLEKLKRKEAKKLMEK